MNSTDQIEFKSSLSFFIRAIITTIWRIKNVNKKYSICDSEIYNWIFRKLHTCFKVIYVKYNFLFSFSHCFNVSVYIKHIVYNTYKITNVKTLKQCGRKNKVTTIARVKKKFCKYFLAWLLHPIY